MSKDWGAVIFIIKHKDQLNKQFGRVDGAWTGT